MIEKDLLFDKRIMQRNVRRGRLTKDQIRKHLHSLPDLARRAVEVTVEVRPGEFKVTMPEPEE
jgi:hypothetical protein